MLSHGSLVCVFVFFFKQKTAYEMRISDWSSDVCSSDLFRYSDYSLPNVSGVWTYGGGATWQIIPEVMIRGQYQRAVRAPSVDELFRSNSTISEAATDP